MQKKPCVHVHVTPQSGHPPSISHPSPAVHPRRQVGRTPTTRAQERTNKTMSAVGSFSVSRLAARAAVAWKPSRVTSSSASRCRAHFFTRATPRPASAAVTDVAPPTAYTTAEADDRSFMRGKAILVTGATSGLGAELVSEICKLGLQARPSRVILVARDASKAAVTTSQLQAAGKGRTARGVCVTR